MAEPGERRRLAAILAADMVGYSRLMEADERGTIARQRGHRAELIDPKIAEHHGRIVKTTGDGALVEFASVVDAVECAVAIQREMVAREADVAEQRRIRYRFGINLGDVVIEGDDIFGDGVNIAARLEELAEPGGICISGTTYDQLKQKVDVGYEFLGEQHVKNIAEPLRAYRVLIDETATATVTPTGPTVRHRWLSLAAAAVVAAVVGGAMWWRAGSPDPEPESVQRAALPLPEKPSIAVLPFTNISGDPEQEYFADGITDDLITDLSKISGLFVIARNSSFVYKGASVDVHAVARELGVKFVLEGSVRRADERVRVNAQLIDAATGGHLWAERYDGSLGDVFALQDKVTTRIVSALALQLTPDEEAQQAKKETENVAAYDAFLRAGRLLNERDWMERPDNDQAREWLHKAIALDPTYAAAYASLGFTYWLEVRYPNWWGGRSEMNRAFDLAQKAIDLGGPAQAYRLLAQMYLFVPWDEDRDYDKAVAAARTAVDLNPNDADSLADLADVLIFSGETSEALDLVERAKRLNPNFPDWYHRVAGYGYLLTGRHEKAVEEFTPLFEEEGTLPMQSLGGLLLTASLAHSGRTENAKAVLAPYLTRHPATTVTSLAYLFKWFKRREHLDIVLDGLRKAGLPE